MSSPQALTDSNKQPQPKSNRKPLQPKNSNSADNVLKKTKPPQHHNWFEISLVEESNKENNPIASVVKKIEPFDSSLAEELGVIRKRLEKLRLEKEKTEKMLRERDLVLEMEMKEMEKRGDMQKKVELEFEKLMRLNQLKSICLRTPSTQSLREREEEKKTAETKLVTRESEENKSMAEDTESSESVERMEQTLTTEIEVETPESSLIHHQICMRDVL